jgi:hypothetical protein
MTLAIDKLIEILDKRKSLTTVGKPKSNWREKIYPKPRIWVTRETLKHIKNGRIS